MSIKVSWRGRLKDPGRIDSFEDALLEIALEAGGRFTAFGPEKRLRGGLLDLAPGLPRIPFGVAKDGTLGGAPADDGWVSVDVRHASGESRERLAAVLQILSEEFCPGLEVRGLSPNRRAGSLRPRASRRPQIGANDPPGIDPRAEGTEEEWDEMYRRNDRRNAGLMRAMDLANEGESEEPLVEALRSEGVTDLPGEGAPQEIEESMEEESWEPEPPPATVRTREPRSHPLLSKAQDLTVFVLRVVESSESALDPEHTLATGVLELSGGLAQVLQTDAGEDEDSTPYGIAVVQMKRALRGIDFALGSIPACRDARRVKAADLDRIEKDLQAFQAEISSRLATARSDWARERGGLG